MLMLNDVLVMQQVTSFTRSDFAITDGEGLIVGHIQTQGDLGSRLVMGSRHLRVFDGPAPSFDVIDVFNFGRDRFEIQSMRGDVLAEIRKELSFFRTKLSALLADGVGLELTGDIFGWNYQVGNGAALIATVAREWPGVKESFLGRDRYVIAFSPTTGPMQRQAVIGSTIAIDMINAKEDDNASVSWSL